jgi:hypothetical protein
MTSPIVDLTFPHHWQAQVLDARPLILPPRHFTYPAQAEEVERGALEVLIRPSPTAQEFLATCALGFRSPAVLTGLWSCPHPDEICALSGGYAYMIDTNNPAQFAMLSLRPVLEVRPLATHNLLLFIGHHSLLAWGAAGQAWQTEKLSDEGITLTSIDGQRLYGLGWSMMTDKETLFMLDLATGIRTPQQL